MSRQTKFKIGDKVRRTSYMANGTHTYGTVDTVVGIAIAGVKEWITTKNNVSADCDADNYELVERAGAIKMTNEKLYLREDWLPIETAPKDGNRLCLARWNNENYFCWITIGWWDKKRKAWLHDPDGRLIPPTHWMPIPQSPKGEK